MRIPHGMDFLGARSAPREETAIPLCTKYAKVAGGPDGVCLAKKNKQKTPLPYQHIVHPFSQIFNPNWNIVLLMERIVGNQIMRIKLILQILKVRRYPKISFTKYSKFDNVIFGQFCVSDGTKFGLLSGTCLPPHLSGGGDEHHRKDLLGLGD